MGTKIGIPLNVRLVDLGEVKMKKSLSFIPFMSCAI